MAWATVKVFDAAHAPPGATLKGGGYRTTGRVKALARCASIVAHATFPSLSSDIRRAAPVHGEKAGLGPRVVHRRVSRFLYRTQRAPMIKVKAGEAMA